MKGRPAIDREMVRLRERLATVNAGLLACYETIAVGQRKKATIEAEIEARAWSHGAMAVEARQAPRSAPPEGGTHMSSIDRRQLLVGAGAVAVLPAVPAIALTPPPLPFLPAFAVGTPGDHNWRVFFAKTAERARELWYADYGTEMPLADEKDTYNLHVTDVPHLGNVSTAEDIHQPSVSDCIAMGWDNNCDRCHCDVSCDGDNYLDIGGDCVCQECLTPQEIDAEDHDDFLHWFFNERFNITDPAVFALLRPEDFLDTDVLDALAEEAALHPACIHLMPFARAEPNSPTKTSEVPGNG